MIFLACIGILLLYLFIALIVHRAMYKFSPFCYDDCTAFAVFWVLSLPTMLIIWCGTKASEKIIVYIDRYLERFGGK